MPPSSFPIPYHIKVVEVDKWYHGFQHGEDGTLLETQPALYDELKKRWAAAVHKLLGLVVAQWATQFGWPTMESTQVPHASCLGI